MWLFLRVIAGEDAFVEETVRETIDIEGCRSRRTCGAYDDLDVSHTLLTLFE